MNDVELLRNRIDALFDAGMYEEAERLAEQRETLIKSNRQQCKLLKNVVH